ncbi:O-Methyltransferase family 2 [Colletotrichum higginsianum]|nr:O-Methyltransferase family 2 [Colletotrichum higginsianum]
MSRLVEFSPAEAEDILRAEQLSHDLFKLTLTRHNKSSIFAEAIGRLDRGRDEADLILRNLRAWSPDVAEHFPRRTSDVILDTPFRLLCSSPSGIPLDGAFAIRQYLAVSYSWHGTDWPETPGSVPAPGGVWPVGGRFAEAILAQRGHPREGVWIDQVCIDQADDAEKQRAIACMDVVYKSCRRLVVLLEDVELAADEAALCERYGGGNPAQHFDRAPRDQGEASCLVAIYDKIAAARWWQRAWCFHEFVVAEPWSDKRHIPAHNAVFIMGVAVDDDDRGGGCRDGKATISLEWTALHAMLSTVMIQLGHRPPASEHLYPILGGFANRTSPLLDSRDRVAGATTASFMARFNAVAQTGCSMPGDRLSVCLNLIGLGLAYFRAREPTPEEVYFLAVLLSLAAGEKVPLAFAGSKALVVGGTRSWLARSVAEADTTLPKFSLGGNRGIHGASVGRLEIDLVFFEGSFAVCAEEELRGTYAIFPDVIRSTPPPLKTGMGRPEHFRDDEETDLSRRRFLAAVVAGGHGLAGRLWAQLEREAVQANYNTGMFDDFVVNKGLRLNAADFLTALGRGGDEGEITEEKALALLTWITDPRSIYWISAFAVRIPCSRDGEQALLTAFHFEKEFLAKGDESQIRVAVPTDLIRGDCAWTRAWLLVSTDDTEGGAAWRFAGKALLLGEGGFLDKLGDGGGMEDAAVVLRERQVIIG